MTNTIVLQSHTSPLPFSWIQACLDSVKNWASDNQFDYTFIGDELFDHIDEDLLKKLGRQIVIATDLARIRLLQAYLKQGYDTVVWCDADFLIFAPKDFKLSNDNFSLGREVWIQYNEKSAREFTAKVKVHNAFMMYSQGNSFLDFYCDTAEHLLHLNTANMPPQFIGPKLLTALHNIVHCPVAENAGMLSPLVIKDISYGSGSALDLYKKQSKYPTYAANLCSSLYSLELVSAKQMDGCIAQLLNKQNLLNIK